MVMVWSKFLPGDIKGLETKLNYLLGEYRAGFFSVCFLNWLQKRFLIFSKDSRVDWFRALSQTLWEEMDCTFTNQGHCVKVEPVKGNGLCLTLHRGGSLPGVHGDGLYLKRGSTIQDGSGLILGPNSPFKNIPILNLLL